jgi:hypothetical protein
MILTDQFPDFDAEGAGLAASLIATGAWEDTSWRNDVCPSIQCDVFVLWIDYADRAKREWDNSPRFSMVCEGEPYLETDDWADVLAFINDGRRDFPDYPYRESSE